MTSEEEYQLVQQAKKNPEVFGAVFDFYYKAIFNYCLRRVGNKTVAEDITSEIFFKCVRGLKDFTWQKDVPFRAWLYRIASNEVINYYRKNVQAPTSLDQLQESVSFDVVAEGDATSNLINTEEQNERFDLFVAVKFALNSLPEHYAEALRLRYLDKLSVLEVSAVLNKPEGTVKSLLSRGVDMLQEQMGVQP